MDDDRGQELGEIELELGDGDGRPLSPDLELVIPEQMDEEEFLNAEVFEFDDYVHPGIIKVQED